MKLSVTSALVSSSMPMASADSALTNVFNAKIAAAFGPLFNVQGLGWKDVVSFHLGAQVEMNERLTLRAGYMYVTELFPPESTFFNVGFDLGYQHAPAFGGSFALNEFATVSFAYNYLPDWGSTGPFVAPIVGPVAGTSVTNRTDAHIGTFGINVRY